MTTLAPASAGTCTAMERSTCWSSSVLGCTGEGLVVTTT
eukprot:CAMPEP_0168481874 /NCGR_PEP_ID=MMETSP0228-20121227/64742_1 /TAXON_ID=133427 /ORGANISM="Protoceratium reticulatum, Strain CCCM 535 (=CCMP 1889)" /LENGTH=38 /DNA_ID= /DNA_START= /DNA_END= /DNA_ORIENTATION=